MKPSIPSLAASLYSICRVLASPSTYPKSLDITGAGFYDQFRFDNLADPTHGRVSASLPFIVSSSVLTGHVSPVPTSISRSHSSTTSPTPPMTRLSYALTTQPISSKPILVENQSASSPTQCFQPLSQCVSAEFFIRLSLTCLASTYVTCQKDAGEPLHPRLVLFSCLINRA